IEQIQRDLYRFFWILSIKNQKKSVKISLNLFNLCRKVFLSRTKISILKNQSYLILKKAHLILIPVYPKCLFQSTQIFRKTIHASIFQGNLNFICLRQSTTIAYKNPINRSCTCARHMPINRLFKLSF
ncbi:MAG: hypothetical protein RLZZ628_4114, partial [Bacteroidota bacterium]